MSATGKGTGMHLDASWVRFGKLGKHDAKRGYSLDTCNVPEARRLLRTDKSVAEIAECLGVESQSLRAFIKRRQLCRSLKDRQCFISLQKSLAKLDGHGNPIRRHSSDGEQPHCRRKRADSSPAVGTNSEASQ